ncbi:hypothetical protein DICPUDRAFT_151893 [Dictyostelium purpureum]|uniref:Uncharacterized protein n=1 Tax=Dictyostelium purpureum TaxID=5786 RepID=F0ZK09_DICPU|nr:uncharacterized protein DICPUDRAFT_151893 [Dictyostelium purpureum]EGC35707.1 hypothetical protein DICPUDRAFT_151893 [Dictyostelium purpureum]|eukprot:XP_003287763.1 hypothetical protein DICPUDRAFT_151893 [Dictyostelium purpureum]
MDNNSEKIKTPIRMASDKPPNVDNSMLGKKVKKVKKVKPLDKKYKGLKWKKTIRKIIKEYPDPSIQVLDVKKMVIQTQLSKIEKDLNIIFNEKIQKPNKYYCIVGSEIKRLQVNPIK